MCCLYVGVHPSIPQSGEWMSRRHQVTKSSNAFSPSGSTEFSKGLYIQWLCRWIRIFLSSHWWVPVLTDCSCLPILVYATCIFINIHHVLHLKEANCTCWRQPRTDFASHYKVHTLMCTHARTRSRTHTRWGGVACACVRACMCVSVCVNGMCAIWRQKVMSSDFFWISDKRNPVHWNKVPSWAISSLASSTEY